jgi:pSer/pThr/pTyr-binding forkhead associated (FHA) protein
VSESQHRGDLSSVPVEPLQATWDERTADASSSASVRAQAAAHGERCYLLVFERDSSSLFQLPRSGQVVIGRAETSDLRLTDSSVSRTHAKVYLSGGEAQICDLGSSNGTRVNGERISGARALASGDVVTICNITLVFHSSARPAPARVIVDLAQFRQRAEEELERALRYDRPLTLLAATVGASPADQPRLALALAGCLRLMDVAGWGGPGSLSAMPRAAASSGLRYVIGWPRWSRSVSRLSRQVEWIDQRPCGVFQQSGARPGRGAAVTGRASPSSMNHGWSR